MFDITKPLVTVYITNYNYGKYIKTAIDSVLRQTFTGFELIIIDDGSTDNSRQVILEYEEHPQVRIIFQDNKGLNQTNNIALKASRGQYIMRLDADDFLDSNALLVMSNALNKSPDLGLVFPDYYYVDAAGNITGQEKRHDFNTDVTLHDQPAHGACTMIRKRCLIGVGGYSEDFQCQDGYELWLKFVEKHDVQNVSLPLFYYRRHGKNLTSNSKKIIETRAEIKNKHAEKSKKPFLNVMAILPVRGKSVDPGCLALEILGDKFLIDWTIDSALKAGGIKKLVVTSPDKDVLDYVGHNYKEQLTLLPRDVALARENTPLHSTIDFVIRELPDIKHDCIMLLSTETPFRNAMFIDKAINTMRIFDVDSVIPIMPESDLFFQHNGHGLQPLGNDSVNETLRYERNYIYRKLLGTSLVATDYFINNKKEMGGRIGHIVFTSTAAICVRNKSELAVANHVLEQQLMDF